jgi:hypothetical protein
MFTHTIVIAEHKIWFQHAKCDFYTQNFISSRTNVITTRIKVISTRKVQFPPAECDFYMHDCNVDTDACEYDTHECDYDTLEDHLYKLSAISHAKCDFYTQYVALM